MRLPRCCLTPRTFFLLASPERQWVYVVCVLCRRERRGPRCNKERERRAVF